MEKDLLKSEGLLFGRNLQKALKIVSMYASVDHSAADQAAQQTYASLGTLLKQAKEFTLGFMNERLLLNNVLTGENPLGPLESEFTKRGIAAVTFEAGITLREFKRGLAVLATAPKTIDKEGGLKRFLERNPLERVRIVPIAKTKDQSGDTVLPVGSESYLLAQAILEPQAGMEDSNLDMVLQAAGVGRPTLLGGSGGEIRDVATKAVQRILEDPQQDLTEACAALTRLFEQLTPDYLLTSLSPEKQKELPGRSARDLVVDLVEDTAVLTAGTRLAGAPSGAISPELLEEALRILGRGLRATSVAERLLKKLARFIQEAGLPGEINDRIREELVWFSLPEQEKHAELLRLDQFDARKFRRLVNYVHDAIKAGKADLALEVTKHFFACLDSAPPDIAREQLKRAPELLGAVAGPETPQFLSGLADRLCPELTKEKRDPELHRQVVSCVLSLAHNAAPYEDFALIQRIGADLQSAITKDPAQHAGCCAPALEDLLTASGADRLIELYLENADNPTWARFATNLLRLAGPKAADRLFERLAEEAVASKRFRLIRLVEQVGQTAIEAARKRLSDDRWYVVRNACHVLGKLGDPELSIRLRVALKHPEVRVQQAAALAIIGNRVADRAVVFAETLTELKEQVLEMVLDELAFLKDPSAINGLERFISQKENQRARSLEKAVRVLAAVSSDSAAEALNRVLSDTGQASSVRRAALAGLSSHKSPHAHRLMFRFSRLDAKDELVVECQHLLGPAQPQGPS